MKPEHAQEIYDMLLELATNHICEYRTGRFSAGLKRAKKLLGLERPDVPEPGTIVEYLTLDEEDISWGEFTNKDEDGWIWIVYQKTPCGHDVTLRTLHWRYPGEKEWRE